MKKPHGNYVSQEEFIKKCKSIYGEHYDYSNTIYTGVTGKISVLCPVHGAFQTTPTIYYKGEGCKKCLNQRRFIEKSIKLHNDKYNYDKVLYTKSNEKVCVICKIHGEFWITPAYHIKGYGCTKCREEDSYKNFIKRAEKIHNNLYTYISESYSINNKKIKIVCKKHGIFTQYKHLHLQGKGCPVCGKISSNIKNKKSLGEEFINNWLISKNINFKTQVGFRIKNRLIIVDFVINKNNKEYIVEYNGAQHYEYIEHFHKNYNDFLKQKSRDRTLEKYCKNNSEIELVTIHYSLKEEEIIEILSDLFL